MIFGVRTEALVVQIISGLSNGMILFIMASGLSLIFGVMRVTNFAHGGLYMLGAFFAVELSTQFEDKMQGFILALLVAPLLLAFIGLGLETTLFRRIYKKEHLLQLLLTFGITLIIADLARMRWGGDIYRLSRPDELRERVEFLGVRLQVYDLFLLGVGVLIALSLAYLLRFTRFGRVMRASVANPEMVGALGINTRFVSTSVFMLGSWLAGLGGMLVAGRSAVGLGMDSEVIVNAFAIVVIGGLGSIPGALIGSLIIGVVLSVGILSPQLVNYAQALPFAVMALVLILRPWGLLGKPER
jgi:branched-chain amino acid transport system permease protein